ncbi:MAG: hypothetical protein ABR533_07065 [Desulfonatronovibrio sp.]
MKDSNPDSKPRSLSLKAVAAIVFLAIFISVVATLLVVRIWFFPSSINPVDLNEQEKVVLNAKLGALKSQNTADENNVSKPSPGAYTERSQDRILYFTQRELNAMIARNPDLARKVSIHLSDRLISATMIVTLPADFPVFGGRTVRISSGLHVDYQQGKPVITVEGVSIMGVPVPGAWLGGIKGRDLTAFYAEDEGFWSAFAQGVNDLKIEDGRLRVELAE